MTHPTLTDRLVAPLRRLAVARGSLPASDGQLLSAFVASHDPAAFEGLVRRHGPMVLGVCRRVVGEPHAADDAFQAVFVVLARRAAAITPRERVADWLFGVAFRTALKAKGQLARRRTREQPMAATPEPFAPPPDVWTDLGSILDAELAALPDRLRLPVVLCDLEGRTQREVARQLNVPPATLANRLASARRLLATRLTARGITLAAGAVAAVVTANAAAAVPPALAVSAITLGVAAAGGSAAIPANVLHLSEGVLRMMAFTKIKAAAVLAAAALTLVVGLSAGMAQAEEPKPVAAKPALGPGLTDAEFLRRTCEALRGTAPTPAETGFFAADTDAGKRKKVVRWLTEEGETKTVTTDLFVADRLAALAIVDANETDRVALLRRLSLDMTGTPNALAFSPDGQRLAVEGSGLLVAEPPASKAADGVRMRVQVDPKTGKVGDWTTDLLGAGDEKVKPPVTTSERDEQSLGVWFTAGGDRGAETDDAFLTRAVQTARGAAPTRLEREYFLADKGEKKRDRLLDLLLSDPATAKKLGPDWKESMLHPPQSFRVVLSLDAGRPEWVDKLVASLAAAKKTDDQVLEALTLAVTGRLPTDAEKKLTAALVAKQKDKTAAWQEVAGTLAGTDEAKAHADRLKPKDNVLWLRGGNELFLTTPQPTPPPQPKPAPPTEPKKK